MVKALPIKEKGPRGCIFPMVKPSENCTQTVGELHPNLRRIAPKPSENCTRQFAETLINKGLQGYSKMYKDL